MKWYCTVCGYVYEVPKLPRLALFVKAPKEKFKQMDEEASFRNSSRGWRCSGRKRRYSQGSQS